MPLETEPAQPAVSSTAPPTRLQPRCRTPNGLRRLCAERAALKTERDDSISKVITLQLLVTAKSRRKMKLDAMDRRGTARPRRTCVALRPLVLQKDQVKLVTINSPRSSYAKKTSARPPRCRRISTI